MHERRDMKVINAHSTPQRCAELVVNQSPTAVLHSKCSGVGAVASKTPGGLKTKSFGHGFGVFLYSEDELNNQMSRKAHKPLSK